MSDLVISVILPTIRPEAIGPCLNDLSLQAREVPLEVVVVADFDPPMPHTPWITRERRGVIDAVKVGYEAACGEAVFLTNDETAHQPHAIRRLVDALEADCHRLVGPRHVPAYPFVYYGKPFLPFPCGTKQFFASVGGFLDPIYRGFYADPDLSLRVHAAGYPLDEISDAVIVHTNDIGRPDHRAAVSQYLDADRATFRARWDHLGAFCDP